MKLLGEFNVYNILAATAVFYGKGFPMDAILEQIEDLNPVRGRMEKVLTDLPIQIYIDYAHTPDAIEKAIEAALPYKKPGKKLIFLVGTGGNRDKSKRPAMAKKASKADYVVLTTDDPRFEEYDSITGDL
ncbi:UDP-N-acetylmuramyl peptide synthase, partial [Butyricicoccus sp. 1XD8-22]